MTRVAMILAAGRGTRLLPITADCPKPLLQVAGAALIDHQLDRLAAVGIERVVVNLHHLGDMIRDHLGDGSRWQLEILYSEEAELQETAGGIIQALPLLGTDPFLLLNGDIHTDFDLAELAPLGSVAAHLLMVPRPHWQQRGDFDLAAPGSGPALLRGDGPGRLTYAGIARFHPAMFDGLEPGHRPLRPVLDAAIAANRVTGQVHEGQWEDIGNLERLEALRRSEDRRQRTEGKSTH